MDTKQNNAEFSKEMSSKRILKQLFILSKRYCLSYILLGLGALIVSATSLLETEGLRRTINAVMTKSNSLLKNGILIFIVSLAIKQTIEFFRSYFCELLDFVSIRNLQSILITKLNQIKYKNYITYHTGDLIDRIKTSSINAQGGLNNSIINIFQNAVLFVLIIIYLLIINLRLTLISLIFVIALPIIIKPLSEKLKKLYDESMKLSADKSTMIQDAVQGSEIVRVYLLSDYFSNSLEKFYSKIIGNAKKVIPYECLIKTAPDLISLGDFVMLAYGGYLISKGQLQVGDVIAFLLLFEELFMPISNIATILPQLQASLASAGRIFEIMDLEEEDNEIGTPLSPTQDGDIIFDNVSFGYNNGEGVLKNINFKVKKGKVTAIVGPSGSGKSTIISLLLGLYYPDDGKITYSDLDISTIKVSDWRKKLAYVSQDNSLFSCTIRENIVYGKPGATFEEVMKAAKIANINDFVENRNEGFDAIIGEKGINLSGGEKQRISIARAILSNRDILLLDEPTSALDNENEKLVMDALNNLMKNKTTIVVAHRLSTIINADEIIYIEKGEVLESGTHSELVELNGRYCAMYNTMKEGK